MFRKIIARSEGVGLLSLASIFAAAVSFLINVVTARSLGPDGRGAVALCLQLAYLSAPLAGLGVERALLRRSGEANYGSTSGGRLASAIVLFALAPIFGFVFGWAYILAAPIALVTVAFQILRSRAIIGGNVRQFAIYFGGYQLSILAGSLLLAAIGARDWRLWAVVYAVPGIVICVRSFGLDTVVFNPLVVLRKNLSFVLAAVSQLIVLRFERLLLGGISGEASLGLYIVVATATEPLYWIGQALADHRTRKMYKKSNRRQLLRMLLSDFVIFLALGSLGGALLWFALVPIFGATYSDALPFVLPLSIAAVALAMYRQAASLALSRASEKSLGITEGLLAALAIVIYLPSVYYFGPAGAAWSSVLVYTIGFGGLFLAASRDA